MSKTITNLRYKSFDSLMASIERDLYTFADEGYIIRGRLIKEARRVNADLGLRINVERETIIDVVDHTALLPSDFLFLQLAVACHVGHETVPVVQGAQTEAHTIDLPLQNRCSINSCDNSKGPCDNYVWVTQRIGVKTYTYTDIRPLSLTKASFGRCSDLCINHGFGGSKDQASIQEDHMTLSFKEGKIFINYLADMVDDDNNVMILDHPLVNDYYEYAIKKKFFEMMKINKEGDFLQDYQIMSEELRKARIQAISLVNTPEYGELIKMFTENRHRFYKKYVGYFNDSHSGFYNNEPHSANRHWHPRSL